MEAQKKKKKQDMDGVVALRGRSCGAADCVSPADALDEEQQQLLQASDPRHLG